jgi:hypothetical protein
MKKLIALSAISIAFFALNASAKLGSPVKVEYAGDLDYKEFCEAIVKDDVKMLRRSVRSKVGIVSGSFVGVVKYLTATDGMQCNGVGLLSFSKQHEASKVFRYLSNAR